MLCMECESDGFHYLFASMAYKQTKMLVVFLRCSRYIRIKKKKLKTKTLNVWISFVTWNTVPEDRCAHWWHSDVHCHWVLFGYVRPYRWSGTMPDCHSDTVHAEAVRRVHLLAAAHDSNRVAVDAHASLVAAAVWWHNWPVAEQLRRLLVHRPACHHAECSDTDWSSRPARTAPRAPMAAHSHCHADRVVSAADSSYATNSIVPHSMFSATQCHLWPVEFAMDVDRWHGLSCSHRRMVCCCWNGGGQLFSNRVFRLVWSRMDRPAVADDWTILVFDYCPQWRPIAVVGRRSDLRAYQNRYARDAQNCWATKFGASFSSWWTFLLLLSVVVGIITIKVHFSHSVQILFFFSFSRKCSLELNKCKLQTMIYATMRWNVHTLIWNKVYTAHGTTHGTTQTTSGHALAIQLDTKRLYLHHFLSNDGTQFMRQYHVCYVQQIPIQSTIYYYYYYDDDIFFFSFPFAGWLHCVASTLNTHQLIMPKRKIGMRSQVHSQNTHAQSAHDDDDDENQRTVTRHAWRIQTRSIVCSNGARK